MTQPANPAERLLRIQVARINPDGGPRLIETYLCSDYHYDRDYNLLTLRRGDARVVIADVTHQWISVPWTPGIWTRMIDEEERAMTPTTPSALPLPTPFNPPAPLPAAHNPSPHDLAMRAAGEYREHVWRGDVVLAQQTARLIDELVGYWTDDASAFVWPAAIAAAADAPAIRRRR